MSKGAFGEPWRWGDGWNTVDAGGVVAGEEEGTHKYLDLRLYDVDGKDIIPIRVDHFEPEWDVDAELSMPSKRHRDRLIACVAALGGVPKPEGVPGLLEACREYLRDLDVCGESTDACRLEAALRACGLEK